MTVPINTTATVELPTTDAATVLEGGRKATSYPEISAAAASNGNARFVVGSGDYDFSCEIP